MTKDDALAGSADIERRELLKKCALCYIPEHYDSTLIARDKLTTVGCEEYVLDGGGMAAQWLALALAGCDLPAPDRLVDAASYQRLAVRAERQAVDTISMSFEHLLLHAGCGIPQERLAVE